jgi:hypothetical protein
MFAVQMKLFESEDEFPNRPHETLKDPLLPSRVPDESEFLTFENDKTHFAKEEIR